MKLSFVIPCYRSENTIETVVTEIEKLMRAKSGYTYEVIAVNDCSPDNVWNVLKKLAEKSPNVKIIDCAKNMGQHAALMAGYMYADGDIVVSLDDDGQCPVDKVWDLIAPLQQGYDITIAHYPKKTQSRFKNFGSKLNDLMASFIIGKPKDLKLSNFYAMKKFICQEIIRYGNPYPYIDGLLLRSSSRIKNVFMKERERISGSTGYTFSKLVGLWLNGFTAFSVRPLRIATFLGFLLASIGFCFTLLVVVQKILDPTIMAGYSSLMAVILFVGGVLMLLLGLIGEYIGRIYISLNNSPQYVIRQTMNIDKK